MSEPVKWNELLSRKNPSYAARLDDEETKLRWLMSRQPGSLELSYYLIFLLAANARDHDAFEECRRVLKAHPDDLIAQVWSELLRFRRPPYTWRHTSQRTRTNHRRRRFIFRDIG